MLQSPLFVVAAVSCLFVPQTTSAVWVARERGQVVAEHRTVEHLTLPLGLASARPRFGWWPTGTADNLRGLRQTGYRLQVASRAGRLQQGVADLWDSGMVASAQCGNIEYAGQGLRSNQRAFWRVQLVDQDGRAGDFSPVEEFGLGLLAPEDWAAEWIGGEGLAGSGAAAWEEANWLAFSPQGLEAPAVEVDFARTFDVPGELDSAQLRLSADDQWLLFLDGEQRGQSAGDAGAWARPGLIDLLPWLTPGSHRLEIRARNSSQGPAGMAACLELRLAGGERGVLVSDGDWTCTGADGQPAPATVLGPVGMQPWGPVGNGLYLPAPRLLRCEFELSKAPQSATLHWTALGVADVYLNGQRQGDQRLVPGWTDYTRRALARSLDVSAALTTGDNALGVVLADGWYSGYVGYGGKREHYGQAPRVALELHLEYAGGGKQVIVSDGSWRYSTGGTLEADLLMGELWDARLEPEGWQRAGFDASGWQSVAVGAPVEPLRQPHPGPPLRTVAEFVPREAWRVAPGSFVFDLGQNIAGVARLSVRAQPGQRFTLRFGERLNPDRTLYTQNLRGARATDVYIARGVGLEVFEPRFTFHGFQYVEVSGLDPALEQPPADLVVGVAFSSDTPYESSFTSSEPGLDRLMENIRWTQRMNFLDVPTDCPQRDERLGWTGDVLSYFVTAAWNADVRAFFDKWLLDLSDAQRADGQFPMVAPLKVAGDDGGPAWADVGAIVPWEYFRIYGDRRVLARQYPTMKRFIEYCQQRFSTDLLPPKEFHCFGDWVNLDADTPHAVIYSAFFARSTECVALAARELGQSEDAERYQALWQRLRAAFQRHHVDAEGRVLGQTQCAYALALAFDLLDGPAREQAAAWLVQDIEARGRRFTTGFVGTQVLLQALSRCGREDLAAALVLRREFPSWLFTVDQGATSIWERWDGWTPEKGFQDPGMNSFAHYAFGCVGQWLFEQAAGLSFAPPVRGPIALEPTPLPGFTWVRASYGSVRGRVGSAWRQTDQGLEVEVDLPPGLDADLWLPCPPGTRVTESGQSLDAHAHLRMLPPEAADGADANPAKLRLSVAPGRYRFLIPNSAAADGRR
jgi:alpha-L-rhamnosidase